MTFTIDGAPTGKARPRVTRFGTYNTDQTVLYENLVQISYKQQCKGEYSEDPLKITIAAFYDIPKSMTKKNRTLIADGKLYPTKKPDIDNIAKIILDALNGIAYKDDTQVIELTVMKRYGPDPAKVIVYIERIKTI